MKWSPWCSVAIGTVAMGILAGCTPASVERPIERSFSSPDLAHPPALGSEPDLADRLTRTPFEGDAARCRCRVQPLRHYYDGADEVLVGRLLSFRMVGSEHHLAFQVSSAPWKVAERRSVPIQIGDTVRYRTPVSTSECGVAPRPGAVYLVFAPPSAARTELPWIHSCNGTRLFREEGEEGLHGFTDVPGRFVVSQLDALSGLDFLARAAAEVPDESDPGNATLVGLLDIPAFAHGGYVSVRKEPSPTAEELERATSYAVLDSREVSYEVGAAVVLARHSGWFRVRLADGRAGWIGPEEAGTWFPYAELPIRRLAYLTRAWSGHVWPDPGAGLPTRSSRLGTSDRDEYPVEVLEATEIGEGTWFRIRVLEEDPCQSGESRPGLSGWVPAHGVEGAPVVWYYSRGC